jgi:hypothetical protein
MFYSGQWSTIGLLVALTFVHFTASYRNFFATSPTINISNLDKETTPEFQWRDRFPGFLASEADLHLNACHTRLWSRTEHLVF